MSKSNVSKLLPVLLSFFVMGFVDIVGIATSHVKEDFALSDTWASLISVMVLLWFLLISIPTGVLMGRLGRKNTVLLSAVITTVGLLLPLVDYTFPVVLLAFALLGIGNTILQVSLIPLLTSVVPMDRFASNLTFGQFVKAICSTVTPLIAVWVASPDGTGWERIFPVYAAITALSFLWLLLVPIREEKEPDQKNASMGQIFALLKDKQILIYFTVILLIVGYEVGLITALPKYLLERCDMPLQEGGLSITRYFAARTIAMFLGAFILSKMAPKRFFVITMVLAVAGYALMLSSNATWVIYTGLFIVGLAAANVFPIAFSLAIQHNPAKTNEISSLMVTGIVGGAIIPPIMGVIADASTQFASLLVPFACLVYILGVALVMSKKK